MFESRRIIMVRNLDHGMHEQVEIKSNDFYFNILTLDLSLSVYFLDYNFLILYKVLIVKEEKVYN